MKASELRIGNLVTDVANGIGQVRGTTHNALWIRDESGPCPIQNFRPIPLTEEWLTKFGFEHTRDLKDTDIWRAPGTKGSDTEDGIQFTLEDSHFEIKSDGAYFSQEDVHHFYLFHEHNDYFESSQFGIEIKYVHQLQNLYFTLTGEELEIKQ